MSSVEPQTPYNEYTGDGSTTLFPYEFQLLASTDLVVTINGVAVPSSEFLLTGIGSQTGGDVLFNTAPANGAAILLSREIALRRDIDYQYNGPLPEAIVDLDFNRIWQALQGFFSRLSGAVRAPYPEQIPELPNAAARANKTLAFNSNGDPTVLVPVSGSAADVLLQLANSADLTKGDALMAVKQPLTGAVARTQHQKNQDLLTVEDFGAVGDGVTDDSAAFQAAHDSGQAIRLSMGKKYMLSTTITAKASAKSFRFLSPSRTARGGKNDPFADLAGPVIEWTGAVGSPIFSIDVYNSQHTDIQGISFIVPNGYTAAAINIQGGPFFTTGGIQSGWLQNLAVYRRGAISAQATTARLLNFDCTGSLADGRVIGGWVLRDLFGFNTQNVLTVNVGNNALGTPGLDNWWNSNLVEDVYGYQVYRLIDLSAGTTNGNAIWRNTFRNCTNQPGKGLDTFFAAGACIRGTNLTQYNNFDHCTAWDLTSGSEFVLPETNIRRGFFGDYFSHTEGLQMYGPTAADIIKSLRPGWLNAYRLRSFGNNGDQMMLSNNYDGTTRDTTSLHGAAARLYTDSAFSSFDIYLGAAVTKSFSFEMNGTTTRVGFHGTAAVAKPTVTGAKGGNAALTSLISALASYGLITDSTT